MKEPQRSLSSQTIVSIFIDPYNLFSNFVGSLYDWTGNYNLSFYVAGSTIAWAGLICFPLRRIARWQNKRELEKKKHASAIKDSETDSTTSSTDDIHINMSHTTSI